MLLFTGYTAILSQVKEGKRKNVGVVVIGMSHRIRWKIDAGLHDLERKKVENFMYPYRQWEEVEQNLLVPLQAKQSFPSHTRWPEVALWAIHRMHQNQEIQLSLSFWTTCGDDLDSATEMMFHKYVAYFKGQERENPIRPCPMGKVRTGHPEMVAIYNGVCNKNNKPYQKCEICQSCSYSQSWGDEEEVEKAIDLFEADQLRHPWWLYGESSRQIKQKHCVDCGHWFVPIYFNPPGNHAEILDCSQCGSFNVVQGSAIHDLIVEPAFGKESPWQRKMKRMKSKNEDMWLPHIISVSKKEYE